MTDPNRVLVHEVTGITQHEHAENLTLVALKDHNRLLVANKQDDGSFRYAPGDLVVLLPVGAILPEYLLREMGAWDAVKQKGTLASNRGNRVGARKFAALDGGEDRYESRGALRAVNRFATDDSVIQQVVNEQGLPMVVVHGWDVTEHLGIEMRG